VSGASTVTLPGPRRPRPQPLDPVATNSGDHVELSKTDTQRIDQLRALAREQLSGPVLYQDRLLLDCRDRNKPHERSRHCFADRLGISRIVLIALDVGFTKRAGIIGAFVLGPKKVSQDRPATTEKSKSEEKVNRSGWPPGPHG
jgi:hypothetical protein